MCPERPLFSLTPISITDQLWEWPCRRHHNRTLSVDDLPASEKGAGMAGAAAQMDPTIFSRLERLDVMMGLLEEITTRGSGRTLRSSCASTTSSGSDGGGGAGDSSVGSSPKSLEGRCRPLGEVVRETQLKGPLIVRLHQLEERVLKLSLQLEEEKGESERKKGEEEVTSPSAGERPQEQHHLHHHLKGIKSLVKSCVRGHNKASKG